MVSLRVREAHYKAMFRFLLFVSVAIIACQARPDTKAVAINNYVMFYVYTRTTSVIQVFPDATSINNSPILATRRTVVVVHGHEGSAFTTLNPLVQYALLDHEDCNVIVVDWSRYAGDTYSMATSTVPTVAQRLAEFINVVVSENRTTLPELHLVGFNLGAHLAGMAGRLLGGQIGRITGLDPSRNSWTETNRLRMTDALYVEVIHTDGGVGVLANGIGTRLGTVDFFANGGTNQPGCVTNACNHNRAYELFAASLVGEQSHLIGNLCTTELEMTINTCRGATLRMGSNELTKRGFGMYRVNTGNTYPY